MFGTLLILAVICAVTWLYVRWSRVRQYWALRGVPHLPPHPVMGSLTFLQRQNPTIWMIDMYQKFKSPYTGVWWFWRPVLLINSPELARNVLVKDAANFRDRFTSSGVSDPIGGLNLFTIKDPQWSSVRRHLTNVFTASKLKALQDLFTSKSKDLIHVLKTSEDNSKINLRYLLTDFTTDIIGTAAFGVKTNAILTGEDSMRLVTKAFMEFNWYRGLCWSSVFFFPELVDIFRFTVFPKWATDYFKKVLGIASKQRREELKDLSSPRDLLDALLTLKENDKQDMSDDLVVAQAALFLFAGFDTSGSSLTFSIYELAFQPELQDKLYEEISQVEGELDLTKLGELVYLNCVIKEGLRKYAPLGWLDRIAAKDYQVDDKLTIPAGTPVYVNGIGMHYDEDLFPEPRKFIPDRFLPENEKNIRPFTFMPFGEGPRNCIGKRFGLIVLRHALAYLILNFKMVPLPNGPKPDEIEFDKHSLILAPGQTVNLQFIPRNY